MMKKAIALIAVLVVGINVNAQFTYPNGNEIHTDDEIVAPVIRISNELRLANTFAANDPIIGTLDNTGYGINISKTEGIGFALNNVHEYLFRSAGRMIVTSSNPSIHIEGTGTGNYQGANLILSAKGVTSGNRHVSTWFMTHRSTDGTAAIEMQRRGLNNEYNGSLLTYKDGDGWRFAVAANKNSSAANAFNIKNTGNVGVGTIAPMAKLHVNSNADVGRGQNPAFLVGNRSGLHIAIDDNEIGAFSNNSNSDLYLNGSQSTSNTVINGDGTGKVGIGTTNPTEKLDVIGTIKSRKLLLLDPNDTNDWNTLWQSGFYQSYDATNAPETNQWFWGLNMNHGSNNTNYRYNGQIAIRNSATSPRMYFRSTNKDGVGTWSRIVHSEGNQYIEGALGIGTKTPDAKLAVNGNIHTREVKVDLQGWPDYVFEESYDLPTLQQVENHIQEKGHLINIPSATEVAEKGIYLGEMNAKLLEKIEELTLYTIQQEKRIQELELTNNELRSSDIGHPSSKSIEELTLYTIQQEKRIKELELTNNELRSSDIGHPSFKSIEELTLYTIAQEKEINVQKVKTEKQEEINRQLITKNIELEKRLKKLEELITDK